MKTKNIIIITLIFGLCVTKIFAQSQKHYLNFGPQLSYNLEQKILLLGVGAGYEYRLAKNWGLTAGGNFNMGLKDKKTASFISYSDGSSVQLLNIANNNISVGAKFYLNRFNFNASFGYSEERQQLKFNNSKETRWESKANFYQAYGIGYQIPFKQNEIEIFANASGSSDLNITTGLRLNLGLGKPK